MLCDCPTNTYNVEKWYNNLYVKDKEIERNNINNNNTKKMCLLKNICRVIAFSISALRYLSELNDKEIERKRENKISNNNN